MKITFEDWDDAQAKAVELNDCLSFLGNPDVKSIGFYYDRGRLEVLVNGIEVFKMFEGTQDFSLKLELE